MTAYGTVAELRTRIDRDSVVKDSTLNTIIEAASRNINRATNHPDGFVAISTAIARVYTGSGKQYQFIDECVAITTVAVKNSTTESAYTAWTTDDWIAFTGDHRWPDFNDLPYTALMVDPSGDESHFTSGKYTTRGGFQPVVDTTVGSPTVQVTARWGFATIVPYDIKEAALMQSARWFKRYESAMSDVLASNQLGTLLYRQSLDPDIKRLLNDGRYMNPTVGIK